jgi:hypothetical protein
VFPNSRKQQDFGRQVGGAQHPGKTQHDRDRSHHDIIDAIV